MPVALSCFVMIIAQSAATARVYGPSPGAGRRKRGHPRPCGRQRRRRGQRGFRRQRQPDSTAMADEAGARSQVAQFVFSAIVLVVLLFLTGPLQYLPHSVLASIVLTTPPAWST